ncbi:MAG: AbrB/MazE/SpoVT family DNA-binding domain-containing protein [Mollicutes bacterium]|jgi:AbrB family transcriptional regulator (stage V sporulation protein T)|nr:AbrB/MazE/SpoVT family DNA-binding domain-containing protein [Mollicutes bacterium]
MKATGIVRRIDELGRIVIPKEIRKTLRIKEGENLEIYVDSDENIILRKHSLMNKINDFAQNFAEAIYSFIKHDIIITDTNTVIACAGQSKKDYLNKPISEKLQNSIIRRENILEKYEKNYSVIEGKEESGTYTISSIIANGDAVGLVMIASNEEKITEIEERVAKIASQFLGKYLEE